MVDSHAHLSHEQLVGEVEDVVARAAAAGVLTILDVGFDLRSSRLAVAHAEEFASVLAAVGLHPHDARLLDDPAERELAALARHERVVAVGEAGLDFHRDLSPRDAQADTLRRLIRLAREAGKPLVIHDREAHEPVLAILKQEGASEVGVIMHCFSGDLAFAQRCLDEGFYIGIAGPVTFHPKRGAPVGLTLLQQVAAQVPLDRLLVETDCPYLAPEPRRGHRNEPAYVRYVAEKVADLRETTAREVGNSVAANLERVLGL